MPFPERLRHVAHHPLIESTSGTPQSESPRSETPVLPEFDVSDLHEPPANMINLLEVPNTNWNKSPGSSLNSSLSDLSTTVIIPGSSGHYGRVSII